MADPLPLCYLNGEYLPLADARISPLDRGFLYSDGVYEVMPVYGGRPFRFEAHVQRMQQSLDAIRMEDPLPVQEWRQIIGTLIERNGSGEQYVYWQVTRGAERGRNHAPLPHIPRTVFAFCAPFPVAAPSVFTQGVACVTAEDTRWSRCDIKSVSLLANVLLRQLAVDVNAAETILIRDGDVMEASASAVHVVIDGEVCAPANSHRILPSITRSVMEELADRAGVKFRSVRVTEAQLRSASEVLLSAATREVQAVTSLDGRPVGAGTPGPIWRRIRSAFDGYKRELAGTPW
jgi:D-alanine transaminase